MTTRTNPFRYFNSSPEVIRLVVMVCGCLKTSCPHKSIFS